MTAARIFEPHARETGELYANELHRVLSEARAFADTTGTAPTIHQVRLEATGTHLVAVATNRFVMGASAVPYRTEEPFIVDLPLESVDLACAAIKPKLGRQRSWTYSLIKVEIGLSPQGRRLRVHFPLDGLKLSLPTRPEENAHPLSNWRQLLTTMQPTATKPNDPITPVFPFAVNPDYLRRFAALGGKNGRGQFLRIHAHRPNKGVLVDFGTDDFVGAIMPVRYPTDNHPAHGAPAWLKPPTKKKGSKVS